MDPFTEAAGICKTIMRNGFDAYVINIRLQEALYNPEDSADASRIDIATDMNIDDVIKLYPHAVGSKEPGVVAKLREKRGAYRFYQSDLVESSHPETTVIRLTPTIARKMDEKGAADALACSFVPRPMDLYEGFNDLSEGVVSFAGVPDETLKRNYLLGVRAIRYAANFGLDMDPNTWMAIVRGAGRIIDYCSITDIMDEWRKVEAENLGDFVSLLYDARLLHGIMPEVAALTRVKQIKSHNGEEESALAHTLEVMRRYPEVLPYDWYGVMACLLHDVGKLFTGEYHDGRWFFHQHHRVGAKVARKILRRLRFEPEDIDLIRYLVLNHMRFKYMLTDRGVRRFKALDEYPRLIEMARADIKARGATYTEFNHNLKMLERAETPEEMLEPLLNGNEIMDFTGLKPGPAVGVIRESLFKAQVAGEVSSVPEAVEFVQRLKDREGLS